MVIWKERLQLQTSQGVMLPEGAELLCVQMQNDEPYLWFLGDPLAFKELRTIVMVGTGQDFDSEGLTYIDTVQDERKFVWHFFEG